MHPSRLRPVIVAPLVFLSLSACSRGLDSAVFIPAPPLPEDEEVRIYRTLMPDCAYDELGVVKWEQDGSWLKLQGGVELMRKRARRMGGHAIVGFSLSDRESGMTRVSSDSTRIFLGTSISSATVATGTVVRFRDGNCPGDAMR